MFFCWWSIIIHPFFHGHENTEPYIFRGNDLDFLGSRDVIGRMTRHMWFPIGGPL